MSWKTIDEVQDAANRKKAGFASDEQARKAREAERDLWYARERMMGNRPDLAQPHIESARERLK